MFDLIFGVAATAGSTAVAVFMVADAAADAAAYTRFDSERLARWRDGLRPWVWPAFWLYLVCDLLPVLGDGVGSVLKVLLMHTLIGLACWMALSDDGDDWGDDDDDDDDDDGFDDDGGPDGHAVEHERGLLAAGR